MNPYLQKPIDFANSMANSFYWGFGPEIYGLLTANPHPWKRGSLELYRQNRDAHRRYLNNIQQNSPATHVAGDVAGGLLMAGGMGKAMHTMGQDILRRALGRQPPPVDMSKPIHTQQELVDMSRRNFNKGLLATGATATIGKGLLDNRAAIKSGVKSLRPLIPEAVEFAKGNKLPPMAVEIFKSLNWDAKKVKELEELLDKWAVDGQMTDYEKALSMFSDDVQKQITNSDYLLKDELAKDFFFPIDTPRWNFSFSTLLEENADSVLRRIDKMNLPDSKKASLREEFGEYLRKEGEINSPELREAFGIVGRENSDEVYRGFKEKDAIFNRDVLEAYRRQHGDITSEMAKRAQMAKEQKALAGQIRAIQRKPDILRTSQERKLLNSQRGLLSRLAWWN